MLGIGEERLKLTERLKLIIIPEVKSILNFRQYTPLLLMLLLSEPCFSVEAHHPSSVPEFAPCEPSSEILDEKFEYNDRLGFTAPPDLEFCSEWNPEFPYNGHHCCPAPAQVRKRKRNRAAGNKCFDQRRKSSFCDEVTDEQKNYIEHSQESDILAEINSDLGKHQNQSFCSVNNGFLFKGRPVVSTASNRIMLRSPGRCSNFGTDGMAGLLEWVGRKVATSYADPAYRGVRLVLGDISAPRGGCLSGMGGKYGHASHTTGQDADVGFLYARAGGRSPQSFHTDFDAKTNWWLLKQIFQNPYACVKVVFLDRKLIKKISKAAWSDPDWKKYGRFIRHMPAHKNHMHVRIGGYPGIPGCTEDARPDLEPGEDTIDFEVSAAGELNSSAVN